MSVAIQVDNVTKAYGKNIVIQGLSAEIKPGEFFTLLGPSGCGKTTLLRMIIGFNSIEAGEIRVDGKVVNRIPTNKRNMGMVFQNYAVFPHMSVRDNVAYGLKNRHVPKEERYRRVDEILKLVKIDSYADRMPAQLSGGQQQRVALARAIVIEPEVLLMDEPLSNLDAKLRAQMRVELAKLHKELKTTMIYVTHDQTEAMTLGTRIVVMKDGIVQQADTPEQIYRHPANKFVAGFIGAPSMNFVEAMVTEKNGAVYLETDAGVSLRAEGENEMVLRRNYLGKMVILGLRPEDLQEKATAEVHGICSRENRVKAFVELREMIGAEAYLHMHAGRNQLTARVPSEAPVAVKEYITLYADMEKAQIFDPFTEENILCPPAAKEERATA